MIRKYPKKEKYSLSSDVPLFLPEVSQRVKLAGDLIDWDSVAVLEFLHSRFQTRAVCPRPGRTKTAPVIRLRGPSTYVGICPTFFKRFLYYLKESNFSLEVAFVSACASMDVEYGETWFAVSSNKAKKPRKWKMSKEAEGVLNLIAAEFDLPANRVLDSLVRTFGENEKALEVFAELIARPAPRRLHEKTVPDSACVGTGRFVTLWMDQDAFKQIEKCEARLRRVHGSEFCGGRVHSMMLRFAGAFMGESYPFVGGFENDAS